MYELLTAATSNGMRPAIMLAECGLAHRLSLIDLGRGDQRTPAFLAIHPSGHIPVLLDEKAGLVLTESMAMLIHLAEASGFGLPSAGNARARVLEGVAHAMTDVYVPYDALFYLRDDKAASPTTADLYEGLLRRALGVVDRRLSDAAWLAGEAFSIADITLYPTMLRISAVLKLDFPDLPHLGRWRAAMAARPGVQRGATLTSAVPWPGLTS